MVAIHTRLATNAGYKSLDIILSTQYQHPMRGLEAGVTNKGKQQLCSILFGDTDKAVLSHK